MKRKIVKKKNATQKKYVDLIKKIMRLINKENLG